MNKNERQQYKMGILLRSCSAYNYPLYATKKIEIETTWDNLIYSKKEERDNYKRDYIVNRNV